MRSIRAKWWCSCGGGVQPVGERAIRPPYPTARREARTVASLCEAGPESQTPATEEGVPRMVTGSRRGVPVHRMSWAGIFMAVAAGVLALYGSTHSEKHIAGSPLRQ